MRTLAAADPFVCRAWTATYAAAIERNLPTPWAGVWERVNTNIFIPWIAVLAIALLRVPASTRRREEGRV
ncbi:MAG TPA: hypothetical protein VF491_07355 [Vicinamibacterales bacterium]